ncbi:uncharacterized protein AMSG_00621 [Thecamonas trahens ATCC 50062]|uniref:Uncharacterized protein n=1 Tax=Thecamonas trahens ATCC 50062 TaxID=461836 RepID=A0A0L0DE13_THETB|nr:hypothetical protein AMSG_00621 [Thecamonas trahens ATCC 50062]KNC50460.1 hypothetical protein AMSG_00621 [Thecamonas trahens ATCC 50062]|eukprot:XP_013762356.1 hypothetical protein AMSG_00621 [Thecamonas trahens ATCC 50062]
MSETEPAGGTEGRYPHCGEAARRAECVSLVFGSDSSVQQPIKMRPRLPFSLAPNTSASSSKSSPKAWIGGVPQPVHLDHNLHQGRAETIESQRSSRTTSSSGSLSSSTTSDIDYHPVVAVVCIEEKDRMERYFSPAQLLVALKMMDEHVAAAAREGGGRVMQYNVPGVWRLHFPEASAVRAVEAVIRLHDRFLDAAWPEFVVRVGRFSRQMHNPGAQKQILWRGIRVSTGVHHFDGKHSPSTQFREALAVTARTPSGHVRITPGVFKLLAKVPTHRIVIASARHALYSAALPDSVTNIREIGYTDLPLSTNSFVAPEYSRSTLAITTESMTGSGLSGVPRLNFSGSSMLSALERGNPRHQNSLSASSDTVATCPQSNRLMTLDLSVVVESAGRTTGRKLPVIDAAITLPSSSSCSSSPSSLSASCLHRRCLPSRRRAWCRAEGIHCGLIQFRGKSTHTSR